jgi:peptidoglycan/LPS O-acetylase OafA/YrhL
MKTHDVTQKSEAIDPSHFSGGDVRAIAGTAYDVSDVVAPTATIATLEPRSQSATIRFYRPELDLLRFFAFFGVFFFHSALYGPEFFAKHHLPGFILVLESSLAKAGAYGVDLFFLLSAYLITELLLREKLHRGALDVTAFYIRRILRIWPLYFAFIALVALVPALNPNHEFGPHYVIPFLLLGGNWSLVAFGFPGTSVAVPLWSVSVEEQFYLLWPPIVSKLSRRYILVAAVVMIAIANATRISALLLHAHHPQVWCNTLARLDPMAFGIILAVVLRGGIPHFRTALRLMLLLFGLLDMVLVARYADLNSPLIPLFWKRTLLGYPAVAIGCALVLLAFLGSRSRLIESAALRYLGKISYGLYVFHELAISISDRILTMSHNMLRGGLRFVLALAITMLLAAISYRFLEAPFLDLKRKFTHVPSRPV